MIAALIALAQARLGDRELYAYTGPATATCVPGLPAGRRPFTAGALTAAGCTQTAAQRYFLRDLAGTPPAPPTYPLADVTALTNPGGWRLEPTGTDGQAHARATLLGPTSATAGIAVLSELTVQPGKRRRGIGSHLLAQCLRRARAGGSSHITALFPRAAPPLFASRVARPFCCSTPSRSTAAACTEGGAVGFTQPARRSFH
ncbi:GNAT family N-acetyltransferase [Streptomyces sp. NPDC087908]|uniref:GNAT family N-acetyltransferase n=1 Tax=Streptomyces sp. NPDC087908 TaxID=3365820 RepID=UPI0038309DAA